MAGYSTHSTLFGPEPGQIDFDQPYRIFKDPKATLAFASYHPLTALVQRSTETLSADSIPNEEIRHLRRIVIETSSSGQSFWRFVPTAKREEGYKCDHEGGFPRVVDICGSVWVLDQDQWDIYKLDPSYECIIRENGKSIIRRLTEPDVEQDRGPDDRMSPPECPPQSSEQARDGKTRGKCRFSFTMHDYESEDDPKKPRRHSPPRDGGPAGAWEKQAPESFPEMSSPPVFEDGQPFRNSQEPSEPSASAKEQSPDLEFGSAFGNWQPFENPRDGEPGKEPAPGLQSPSAFGHQPLFANSGVDGPSSAKEKQATERRPAFSFRSSQSFSNPQDDNPSAAKQNHAFEDNPKPGFHSAFGNWQPSGNTSASGSCGDWDEQTRSPMPSSTPFFQFGSSDQSGSQTNARTSQTPEPSFTTFPKPDTPGAQGEIDEEAAHRARIEESRRKLAELEKDRHLWGATRRAREEQERKAKAALEKEKQQRLEEERAKREANEREIERERQLKREEEIRMAAAAAQAKREAESRWRQDRKKWFVGPWSSLRALERYKQLSEEFDKETFSSTSNPLFADKVPWPVLTKPQELKLKNIDWSDVETFFKYAKRVMSLQDYTTFVDKAHKRFHPDRWRSRSLVSAVPPVEDGSDVEATVIVVAQAITPIWSASRRR